MSYRQPAPLPSLASLKVGRRVLLVTGILALLTGAVAILVPVSASVATNLLVGWLLVVIALLWVVDAFTVVSFGRTTLRLLLAVITFAAGMYLLAAPLRGTYTLTVVLVIWFAAIGVSRIAIGIAERGAPGAGLTALSGVVSLLLGILIANELPGAATWAIGLLVGIDLLFYAVSAIGAWWTLRRMPEEAAGTVT